MIKIPMNFKRAFDEVPRLKSCESSGSDHSADLSDLVNSFLEREIGEEMRGEELSDQDKDGNGSDDDVEAQDVLKSLFSDDDDAVRRSIQEEVDKACGEAGGSLSSSPDFKRRLMARLRSRGFDAGICKSKWEKDSRCPWGSYEYIDVEAGQVRYIVEIWLAGAFTIARASSGYSSLLNVLPEIYVGRAEKLKKVVRVMCKGIRRSMKSAGMHVPPWRRGAYMKSKWFASYKRSTNEIPSGINSRLRCREDNLLRQRAGAGKWKLSCRVQREGNDVIMN